MIDTTTWRSPNYGIRAKPPTAIVVHSCEGALPSPRKTSLPWLCNPASKVSTGYYVCRDTTIYQLVDDMHEAWHAGGRQDDGTWTAQPIFSNPRSIGIECEHRAGQDWPGAQKDALGWLLHLLAARYTIKPDMIETHGQIAIKGPYIRKTDPSDWSHGAFVAWRADLFASPPPPAPVPAPPAPLTKRYRVKRRYITQRMEDNGPPLVRELIPGEELVVDKMYSNSRVHLASGEGFVDLADLEQVQP